MFKPIKKQTSSKLAHRVRLGLIVLILGLQVVGIIRARMVEDRYFCWAPYDTYTEYEVRVRGEEGWWDEHRISDRYRIPSAGRDNRSPEHVIMVLRQFEATYGKSNPVLEMNLSYRVNGGAEQIWSWPEER